VAIAQLVDAGRIGLDDPVGRHLGGLTPEASEVTVRQLLTHSGGMGNFFAPENMPAMEAARSLGELKPLIAGERPAFAPGSRSQYSNSGFLILGLLIEAVSGQSYASYLQDKVFAPAGMTRSGMLPASGGVRATGMTNLPEEMDGPAGPPQGLSPGVAGPRQPPAAPPSGGPRMGPPPGGPAGPAGAGGPMGPMPRGPLRPAEEAVLMGTSAGGGYATPPDMQRFFAALHGGRLVSPAMLQALTSPQVELLPARGPTMPAVHYGLGFGLGTVGSHAWSGHGGGAPGLNVATASFPADQTTLVVMSNRDPPAADMLARRLQAVLFDGAACGGG
ncbi:MAG: beta-lactamase family protein, partial [Hyphomonadaceae bacterium]|nr:beta-lactamase family protein [Hyphomonadaceae bacterium]